MRVLAISVLAITVLGAFAYRRAAAENGEAGGYRFSGPYTHDNLTVYLIHGAGKSSKKFLTLQEAMAQGKVVVYETRNVNELAVENKSANEDVYIQSGEIVKGGQQDRTLKDDFILPAGSGKVPISAFCVEHGRWSKRGQESVARFDAAPAAIATKELKMAVKSSGNQSEVWNKVAEAQGGMARSLGTGVAAPQSPSSYMLTLENGAVQKSSDAYVRALSGIVTNKPDVIGYAFAINGSVNSAEVYASHDLFGKLWPKLLKASAVEAIAGKRANAEWKPPSVETVKALLKDADSGRALEKDVTARTKVVKRETTKNVVFETRDKNQNEAWIHRSYISK